MSNLFSNLLGLSVSKLIKCGFLSIFGKYLMGSNKWMLIEYIYILYILYIYNTLNITNINQLNVIWV